MLDSEEKLGFKLLVLPRDMPDDFRLSLSIDNFFEILGTTSFTPTEYILLLLLHGEK